MAQSRTEIVVNPLYRQFYLQRGNAHLASDQITFQGYEDRLESIDGFVMVGTIMYGSATKVVVEVFDQEPSLREGADHIVEAPLAGDGPLHILDWPGETIGATIELNHGHHTVRASWFNLTEAYEHPHYDGGGTEGPEAIILDLWPAPPGPQTVLRLWTR